MPIETISDGTAQPQITKKMMEDAAADARHLMQHSPVIPKLVAVDIIARQLFLIIRQGLDNEIKNAWTLEEPELIIQTLGLAAQERAVTHPASPTELREALLTTVLPVIDIFCQMEAERNEQRSDTTDTPVPGDDPGTPVQLGSILCGTDGHAEQQTGQCGQGDPGEAGETS